MLSYGLCLEEVKLELNTRYLFDQNNTINVEGIHIFKYFLLVAMFKGGGESHKIGPKDAASFRNVVLICVVGIGSLSALIFHITVQPKDALSTKVHAKSL